MLTGKTARDVMVDISKYPHIPSGYSLKQAIEVIKGSVLEGDNCIKPIIALVFDNTRLVGTVRMRDILRGLEPNFLKSPASVQGYTDTTSELSVIWDALFDAESKSLIERPVTEVMSPVESYLNPDDHVVKAAYIMIRNDLLVLPVLEDKKRLIGLVRMIEVFDVLGSAVLAGVQNNVKVLRTRA